jgi:hypothetical protein
VINVEDVDSSTALVDPVDDAICPAPDAVAASELEHRFADPLDCSQARHRKIPVQRQQQFPEAVGDRWCSPALPCQSSCCPGQLSVFLAVPAEQSLVETNGRSCRKRADLPVILPTFEETTLSGGVAQNDFGVESMLEPLGGQP